jgi:hypothetical protein
MGEPRQQASSWRGSFFAHRWPTLGARLSLAIFAATITIAAMSSNALREIVLPEITWTEKADALVRVTHPTFAAQRLRLPLEMILARRQQLNLPPVDEQFQKRAQGPRGRSRR